MKNIEKLRKLIREEIRKIKLNELASEDEVEHQATNLLDYLGGEVEDVPNWRANKEAVEFFKDSGITNGKLASKIYQRAVQLSQENAPRPKSKNKKYLDN